MRHRLVLVFLALAVAGCPAGFAAAAKQELVYNLPAEPLSLDPAYASDLPSYTLALNMFEGLVRLDQDCRPVPAAAQSWKVSADGLVYRFTLRQAYWSDGYPVTAYDFAYAWLRALAPRQGTARTPLLFVVRNAEAYYRGAITDPGQVGVKAVDARTLEVTLAKPAGHFLVLCGLPPFLPVSRRAVEANEDAWSISPKTAVTNGPFRLGSYKPKGQVILTPNAYYRQKPRLQSIVLTWLPSDDAAAAFNSGLVDGLAQPKPGLAGQLTLRPEFRLSYLLFNLRRPPFDQLVMRTAAAAALDRAACLAAVNENELPAYAVVPPGLPDAAAGREFRTVGGGMLLRDRDLNQARQFLAVAGHPDGRDLPEISLLYVTGHRNRVMAEAAAASLNEAGLRVKPLGLSWTECQQRLSAGDFDLVRLGWNADYPDPFSFLSIFAAGAATNFGGYANEAFDAALAEAETAIDPAKRMAALHRAEEILLGDLPLLPVAFGQLSFQHQDHVRGLTYGPYGAPYFAGAWADRP